jgi:dimeric dUTPase (all-alpha-NTP-PPase superfamily)
MMWVKTMHIDEQASPNDKLEEMFRLRASFMTSLREAMPHSQPEWPVDIADKKSQQYCRDLALKGVEEVFEALQHFKNWKPHRQTEDAAFDREKFLEEIVDSFNYFFSLLIAAGFSADDLHKSYVEKDRVIHTRIKQKY